MTEEPGGKPEASPRIARPILFWTAGIFLALGPAWFVGVVVIPYFQVRAEVTKLAALRNEVVGDGPGKRKRKRAIGYFAERDPRIMRLGGPERAKARLAFYLHLPDWLAPHRPESVFLLQLCGDIAGLELIQALKDKDDGVREKAASALGRVGLERPEAVPALVKALGDSSWKVRAQAAQSLGMIGSDSKEVVDALKRLAKEDSDTLVRNLAGGALGSIREKNTIPGQQPP